MRHVVAYSGGVGSFAAAKLTIDAHKDVTLVFTDTLVEDPDLYRFLDETEKYLGTKIVRLSDGRDIWEVFTDVKFMGNNRIDPCSRVLKRELFQKWLKQNYPEPENTTIVYGIDWTEKHRLVKLVERYKPYNVAGPLCDPKHDKHKILKQSGIELPKLYQMGFPHNNCGGFCVKSGQAQFKLLFEKMPERYRWHEERQEKLFKLIKPRGFIRMRVDGKLKYLSMKQFREHLESQKETDEFDFGGCNCFA